MKDLKAPPDNVLLLETALGGLALGLWQRGQGLVWQWQPEGQTGSAEPAPRQASTVLWEALDQCAEVTGTPLATIDGMMVVTGPGSFTGIRTGLVVARTWAMARDIAQGEKALAREQQGQSYTLYPMTTFELAAHHAISPSRVWVVLNAFRQQVSVACYDTTPEGIILFLAPQVLTVNALLALLQSDKIAGRPAILWLEPSLKPQLETALAEDALTAYQLQWLAPPQWDSVATMARALEDSKGIPKARWDVVLGNYLQQPHITQPTVK